MLNRGRSTIRTAERVMFQMPDIGTLRLCSLLLSLAFAAVFLALWRGRREEAHLLHWGLSSVLYAVALLCFEVSSDALPPFLGGSLYGLLAASNVLLLTGLRSFDGLPAFRPWLLLPVAVAALGYALPMLLAQAGLPLPMPLARHVGGSLGLAAAVVMVSLAMLPHPPGSPTRGRRIAALALLSYVPAYLATIATELQTPVPMNFVALLPMLSDQILLAILYLGLLSLPGERAQQVLREAAFRDPLTGAWNRAGFEAQQAAVLAGGGAAILLDIDHFKAINDRHGHAAGDRVLCALASRIGVLAAEQAGWLARLGGDEFVAVLPGASAGDAARVAERMRAAIAGPDAGATPALPRHTVSLGYAVTEPGDDSLAAAVARADTRLYRAKTQGRNRVAA